MTATSRKLLISVFFVTAFASIEVLAQQNGTLSGSVLDPMGAAISSSPISLRWNDLGVPMSWDGSRKKTKKPRKKELTVLTDTAGRFSVPLFPGNWDIFAYHDGLVPVCKVIGIEPGQTTTVELRFPRLVQTTLE
jgi:hypothetical protein